MRIAIYYDDSGSKELDLSSPEKGNPGGWWYSILFLNAYELLKETS